MKENVLPDCSINDLTFVCIGTDRSTGDALGPLVGTALTKLGYPHVIGTMDDPCHAVNLHERIKVISESKTIVAIDACLGQMSSVGKVKVSSGPLRPGAGVNKELGEVGHYHIKGIVNVGGFMEYFVLQNTRLSLVMRMVDEIIQIIAEKYPLYSLAEVAASEEWQTETRAIKAQKELNHELEKAVETG